MKKRLLFILFLCAGYAGFSQSVTGHVRDENGGALPGINVLVKGSNIGSVTDSSGYYSINATAEDLLVFSGVGFKGQEIRVGNSDSITAVMARQTGSLDEVVVIGYGENSRRNISSAIARLNPESVSQRNISSANEILQGQLAGVNVSMSNGMPGSASKVSIRGISSINGDNQPLYVIDGVQVSKASANYNFTGEYVQDPLSMINPSDIESIDVLKDAAASAIYGSRATNGVIIITTKRGSASKPKVSASQVSGFHTLPAKLDLLSSDQYIALQTEAVDNYNSSLNLSPGSAGYIDINKVLGNVPVGYYDVNWQDLILNDNARSNQTDLSFSGGNANVRSFVSFGYMQQDGLIKKGGLDRYSLRSNLDFKVNSHINFGVRLAGNYTKSTSQPNGNQGTALFQRSLEQRPYDRIYKEDGSYNIGGKDILRHNGVQVLETEDNKDQNYQGLFNAFAEIKFLKNFEFRSAYSGELRNGFGFRHLGMLHPYAFEKGATYDVSNARFISSFDNTLSYRKSFAAILDLDVMGGHSFLRETYKSNSATGTEFPSDDFKYISDATLIVASGSRTRNAMESYFGRVQLNYDKRYSFTGTIRRDGSSKFSADNKFDIFPSAAVGWTFSNESFFKFPAWLSYGKLRLSWGQTGNQEGIGNFGYLPLASGGYNYDGRTGLSISSAGNRDLKWETATQTNIGLDLEFLNGRISLVYDYFVKETKDLLYNLPVLSTGGFTTITKNIGSMKNAGHEFALNTVNIKTGDFEWRTSFNLSIIKNKVTSLIDKNPVPVSGWNAIIEGQPIGVFYAYKQLGIYQAEEEIPSSLYGQGVRPGDMRYLDVDNNGNINSSDQVVLGSPLPDFYGGLTNNFRYKGFDVSVFFNFSSGNDIAAVWRSGLDHMGSTDYNMLADNYASRWQGPGTSNTVPRATKGNFNTKNSDYYLEDGSFLKLKNLTLGYSLTSQLVNRARISNARIFASVSNLFNVAGYSGYDPEASSSLDAKLAGQDNLVTPQPRSILFGLHLNF